MANYVTLFRWTDEGVRNVKDSVNRTRMNVAAIERAGGKATVFWTQGRYDLVSFVEMSDEEVGNAITLSVEKSGFARTETMRAFTMQEMESILKKVP